MNLNTIIKKIKSDNFWKNLFKNSFWAFLGDSFNSVIALVVTIILIKTLGSDKYGIIVLAQTYMTIMDIIINMQSWKSVILYGQKAITNNEISKLHSYVKLGSILDLSTAFLCVIISIILVPFIGGLLNWSEELIVCSELFCITIASHFSGTPTAILRIMDKFKYVSIQKIISAIIKIVAIITCIYLKKVDLYTITIVYVLTDIIGNILLVFFAFTIYNKEYGIKGIIKSKMPIEKKKFINFTLWGTLSEIVDIPVNYMDMFIISLLGTEAISIFKVFKQISGILQKITSPIQQSILPQFSELAAKSEYERGFNIVKKIRNVILKFGIPMALIFGLTSPIWLKIIYNEVFAGYWYILQFYLVIQVFALSYTAIHPYFLSMNKSKKSTIITLIANIIYLLLAYFMVKPLGMIGILIPYLIQIIIVVGLETYYVQKYNKEKNYDNK